MNETTWITRGFEAFRRGTFGNAGQNIYVSRNGILQRIHLYDLNRDGWFDLVFCNAQDHWEQPPAFVYRDVFGACEKRELPSDGAVSGVVADLNGDGFGDLVLGMQNNGIERELNAFIYYGSPNGLGEKFHARIPAPTCMSLAAGDFNGDGRQDLAMICEGKLRLFYQSELGFEAWRHTDLDIPGNQIGAADLDGDGYCDIYLLRKDHKPRIYWGSAGGIDPTRFSELPMETFAAEAEHWRASLEEGSQLLEPLARIVQLDGKPHLFVPQASAALLVPVEAGRRFGSPRSFPARGALAVAVADVWGNGRRDVIFACRDKQSWVFSGADPSAGFAISTSQACDVAAGDLDGDGRDEFVICQYRDAESYSLHALAFKANGNELAEPIKLPSDGTRRVLIGRLSNDALPQVVLVNQFSRNATGRVPPVIYWGGPQQYAYERRTELPGLGCVSAIGCDLNDDGIPDLLTVNCAENAIHLDPGCYVFFGEADGFKPAADHVLPTRTAMAAVIGDIDRDGYLDVIFSSFSTNEITIFRGTPGGGFDIDHPQRIFVEFDGVRFLDGRRMVLADLNNDGWLDLVLTFKEQDRTFILWGGPDGFSFDRRQTLSLLRPSTPIVADLTGNGYLDLIIGGHKRSDHGPHDSFVYVYWNGPDGLRSDQRTQLPAHAVLGLALADFNGDGVLDLFVANYSTGRERDLDSYLYWGKRVSGAEPFFSPHRMTPIRTHSAAGCVAADLDGDGRIDLAIANHKTYGDHLGESWIVWNRDRGLDFNNPTKLPTAGPHGMYNNPPGNQRDRGEEEFYTSEPFEMPSAGMTVRGIDWDTELPPKTWVRAQVRSAKSHQALESAVWHGAAGAGSWCEPGEQPANLTGPWIQYRLALGATNSAATPRISEVRVRFE